MHVYSENNRGKVTVTAELFEEIRTV